MSEKEKNPLKERIELWHKMTKPDKQLIGAIHGYKNKEEQGEMKFDYVIPTEGLEEWIISFYNVVNYLNQLIVALMDTNCRYVTLKNRNYSSDKIQDIKEFIAQLKMGLLKSLAERRGAEAYLDYAQERDKK